MGLVTTIKTAFNAVFTEIGDYAAGVASSMADLDVRWPSGTSTGQANTRWSDVDATIADGATTTIDIRNLTNQQGQTFLFSEVRAFRIKASGPITIGKGGTNGWTGFGSAWQFRIGTSGYLIYACPTDGDTSTGASNKTIDITNGSGASVTYSLEIVGTLT